MKRSLTHVRYALLLITSIATTFYNSTTFSCPTCIGRLQKNSPPFFTQTYSASSATPTEEKPEASDSNLLPSDANNTNTTNTSTTNTDTKKH